MNDYSVCYKKIVIPQENIVRMLKNDMRMTNNENNLNRCFWPTMQTAIFVIVALMLFTSCATRKVVEYRDRDVNHYITNTVHDTLIDKTTDSVYFEVKVKGDTVHQTKYKEKTKWRDRVVYKTDTCYKDSIQTVIKESVKEKQIIPKWCYFCLVVCAIFLIFAFRKLIQWLQII